MSETFTLGQLQGWLQHALIRRESDAHAANFVMDSSRLDAEKHLGIYRRSYIARLRECMKNQFSALAYALGDELFQMFADEFLNSYPSENYTLGTLGERFPDFLEATRPRDEGETWPDFMIELARFEYALSRIFDEKCDEEVVLATISVPDDALRLAPIFHLFRHRYPVRQYYLDATKKKDPELPFEQASFCAVTRRNYRLGLTELKEGQYLFLERMAAGDTVSKAKEYLVENCGFEREKLEKVWPEWRKGFVKSGFFQGGDANLEVER
jgi:hypothetical protein